jgi:hypothetical protein
VWSNDRQNHKTIINIEYFKLEYNNIIRKVRLGFLNAKNVSNYKLCISNSTLSIFWSVDHLTFQRIGTYCKKNSQNRIHPSLRFQELSISVKLTQGTTWVP